MMPHVRRPRLSVDEKASLWTRWKLGESLITKYNDGYVQDEKGNARELGYPKPWLREELKKNPGKFTVKDKPKKDKEL